MAHAEPAGEELRGSLLAPSMPRASGSSLLRLNRATIVSRTLDCVREAE